MNNIAFKQSIKNSKVFVERRMQYVERWWWYESECFVCVIAKTCELLER